MNSDYQAALAGKRPSPSPKTADKIPNDLHLVNNLPIPLNMYYLDQQGFRVFLKQIPPRVAPKGSLTKSTAKTTIKSVTIANARDGDWLLFTTVTSGAFVRVMELSSKQSKYAITNQQLTPPFDIGPIPQPTLTQYIPQNSSSILVSAGVLSNGNTVTREQYWSLQGDSYSLAPGESRTISYTATTGKQSTSSTQKTISTQVGSSASDGWGPVSASLSASLNASASVYQQVNISEQTTSYVSTTVGNDQKDAMLVLRWQLVDLITIFNSSDKALASVNMDSIVIVQSYQQGQLKNAFLPPPGDGTTTDIEVSE